MFDTSRAFIAEFFQKVVEVIDRDPEVTSWTLWSALIISVVFCFVFMLIRKHKFQERLVNTISYFLAIVGILIGIGQRNEDQDRLTELAKSVNGVGIYAEHHARTARIQAKATTLQIAKATTEANCRLFDQPISEASERDDLTDKFILNLATGDRPRYTEAYTIIKLSLIHISEPTRPY